jgi:hypothetical protein
MILERQIDVFGDVKLMSLPPDAVYAELAMRKGLRGKIKRSPEFTKQNEILDDRASRFKANNCTRRAAKSTTEAMDHIEVCQEFPRSRTIYMGLTLDSVTDIIWDVFKELNQQNKLGLKFNETKKIIFYPNGSRTRLFGLDSSIRQLAKVLGQKLRKCSIDEAGSITIDLENFCFQKIRPALIDLAPNSWLTLLGTCENIPNTYFQKVTEGKCVNFDWKINKWTTYDNPFLAKQWDAEIKDILKKNPKAAETSAFKTHYLNEWCSDDDLLIVPVTKMQFVSALPNNPKTGKPYQDWHYILAVDLGYNDATAFSLIACNWHVPDSYVLMTFKMTEQDFTDVANAIKKLKKDFPIGSLVIDGANKQGIEEMKKRLGLPEIEIAEKQGKATYLRLLRDEVISGKLKFIHGSTDPLKIEWLSLQWKDSYKDTEDERCQNHLSDATLYGWRKTFALRADAPKETPKETEPEYEQYLEDKEEQQALEELEQGEEIYGTSENDSYFEVG